MLQAKTGQSVTPRSSITGVSLMTDEEVQASVGISEDGNSADGDVVLLTDRRIIHISGSEPKQRIAYGAIEDIGVVELSRQPAGGYGAFVWAGLAFFVSFMLWRVIDSQLISVAAAIIVAIMGAYLIIDRLTSRGEHVLVFKASGAEIRVELKGDGPQPEVDRLIKRLFELKEERNSPGYARASRFSPR